MDLTYASWGGWTPGADEQKLMGPLGESFAGTGFKAFMGWDGLAVRDDSINLVDMCRAYMEQAAKESCGQCFPCRMGTARMARILDRICEGQGKPADLEELERLARMVKDTSKCDIGQTSPRPILQALKEFREQFKAAVESRKPITRGEYVAKVTAPCINACPSHVDIPGYLEKIRFGRWDEALDLIRNDCCLPGTIGRVCVRPCEFNCRRSLLDQPIAIKWLKRYAADCEIKAQARPDYRADQPRDKKVAVIGAGPAGLACAFHLGRMGYKSTIFESNSEGGGMAAMGIPDYRLPREILQKEIALVESVGAEIRYGVNVGPDLTLDDLLDQGYDAVFVGVGAPESASMRCEGEDAGYNCFMTGIEYLRKAALGDPRPIEGQKMVVIGGGNVAMDCTRTALRCGFTDVNLVYRRTEAEMPADPVEIVEAKEEGIKFHYLIQPIEVLAKDGKVSGLKCLKMELGEPDDSGRRRPVAIKGSEFVIEADAVVPAIGQICVVDCVLPPEGEAELTRWKTLVVDEITGQSGKPEIFGGGDCITGPATLIAALAAGKRAARHMAQYLETGQCAPDEGERLEKLIAASGVFVPDEKMPYQGSTQRAHPEALPPEKRIKSFVEVEGGLSPAQALAEADRCLRCYRIGLAAV